MRRMVWPVLALGLAMVLPASVLAQETGVVAGEVLDQNLAIMLPGVPVEVVGSGEIAYTDLDGRYRFELPEGEHELRIVMAGYAEQNVTVAVVEGQLVSVQVALASNVFAEEVSATSRRYLNRLSDLLFVLARVLARRGEGEVCWEKGRNR